jgi:hypothetical protein
MNYWLSLAFIGNFERKRSAYMNPNPNPYDGGPISTIFEKLDEKQRKKIDEAIITRNPSSLSKLHEKFHLAEKGISQQTLYRYARKIRDHANKLSLTESTFTSEIDLVEHLKKQIGRQCLDMILNADATGMSPLDAQRIANTFGKCLQFDLTIARTKALEAATADQSRAREEAVLSKTGGPNHSRVTSRSTRQQLEVGDDPDPGYGTNEDGSPRTHEQYCATVKQVLFEVYAPKSVKEAAAREGAEKAAAAKQNPDNPPLVRVEESPGRQSFLAPNTDGRRVAAETIPSLPSASPDPLSRIICPSRDQDDFPDVWSDRKVAEP